MASHKLAKIQVDDLDVIGYSVAGEESVVAVPQLDVCFDIGKAPDQVIPINNVLLTHGHIDHTAGIAYYLSHRNFCGQEAGTVLAPPGLIEPIEQILSAWGKLDGNAVPAKLVAVKGGDEYYVKPNLVARVFPTKHSRGSVGYTIIEKRKKLKAEYRELNGPQLVELKRQGVEIEDPMEFPLVTYLGDTQASDFSKVPCVANSKVLITECTFYIDEHVERARAGSHIHINDFAKMLEGLNNEHIIVTHVTQRTMLNEARRLLRKKLPAELTKKITFLMDRKNFYR
jgi:ribonuclease Z